MKHIRIAFLIIAVLLIGFFGTQAYLCEKEAQSIKGHLIELSKAKYGLFNVDRWQELTSDILAAKIESFNLDEPKKSAVKKEIEQFLYKLLDEFEASYHQENAKSFKGLLQSSVAAATGTFSKLRDYIPQIANEVLLFLNESKNREALKEFLQQKLSDYAEDTFSEVDYSTVVGIQDLYGASSMEEAQREVEDAYVRVSEANYWNTNAVLILALLVCIFGLVMPGLAKPELVLLVGICLVLLFLGIGLPMIEIDARIAQMKFSLLGEKVIFDNQVLFYKCKSILNVVEVMLTQGKWDLFLVGFLVLTFSVLFPLAKLFAMVAYVFGGKVQTHKVLNWLVFKTGKWSMADVMVVAIFMAFIGFSGILSEQLSQLENISPNLEILTTNESHLQFGFFAFTVFVLLSLITSGKLRKQTA